MQVPAADLRMPEGVVQDFRQLRARMPPGLGVDEHDEGRLRKLRRQKLLRVSQVWQRYPACTTGISTFL